MEIITDLETIHARTLAYAEENEAFRLYVKYGLKWSNKRLDAFAAEIVREVTAAIDCTACANCCRALVISLHEADLRRLAAHLGTTPEDFAADHVVPGGICERTFAQSPCQFLDGSRCGVYAARPDDCREYPHLHKGDIRFRLAGIISNAEDCPIAFNVLERLKASLPARPAAAG